jgi:hypothetical protein|tara:strand:- start:168 stop:389 length:222 start_codon:yes stop_codon:yes gene_type:complete
LEREIAAAQKAGNKTGPGYPLRIFGGYGYFPKPGVYFGSIRHAAGADGGVLGMDFRAPCVRGEFPHALIAPGS